MFDAGGSHFEEEIIMVTINEKTITETDIFIASETKPTNQAVVITVNYPESAVGKEYKIGTGGPWGAYTTPLKFEDNGTVFARWANEVGGVPVESSFVVRNIDKVVPTILIKGVADGGFFLNEVIPAVTVTDNLDSLATLESTVTLNGKDYSLGTPISSQGIHTLVVSVADLAGNTATDKVTFSIKKDLEIIGSIPEKITSKFGEVTIELDPLFNNISGGPVTYEAQVEDGIIASTTINNSRLTVSGLKQGSTTITIIAKSASIYSNVLSMQLTVDNAIPTITLDDDTWSLVGDEEKLIVTGLIKDPDMDSQTVTGSLGDLTETACIPEADKETESWTLTFNTDVLAPGVYRPVTVETIDEFGGKDTVSRTKPIVRVSGDANLYKLVVARYESDTGQEANQWTEHMHRVLLEAYLAVQIYASSDTEDNLLAAKEKVSGLKMGTVKADFQSLFIGNIDSVNKDIDKLSNEMLKDIGITNLMSRNETAYKNAGIQYRRDLAVDLTEEDFQKVIDSVNSVVVVETEQTPVNLQESKIVIGVLNKGTLKGFMTQRLITETLRYINEDIEKLTASELEFIGVKNVQVHYLAGYKEHLALYQPLSQEKIQSVIDVYNHLQITLVEMRVGEIAKYNSLVNSLDESKLKTSLINIKEILIKLLNYEISGSEPVLEEANNAIDLIKTATTDNIRYMVVASEAMHTSLQSSSKESVENAMESIKKLSEGDYKKRLLKTVEDTYRDFLQSLPVLVTEIVKVDADTLNTDYVETSHEGTVSAENEFGLLQSSISITKAVGLVSPVEAQSSEGNPYNPGGEIASVIKPSANVESTVGLLEVAQSIADVKPTDVKEPVTVTPINMDLKTIQNSNVNSITDSIKEGNNQDSAGAANLTTQSTKVIEEATPEVAIIPALVPEQPVLEDNTSIDSMTVKVEGIEKENGYEFVIEEETVLGIIEQRTEKVIMAKDALVFIEIPTGSIDYEKLKKDLGSYGMNINLIKLDEENYRLSVRAVSQNKELEIKDFDKHITVSLLDEGLVERVEKVATTQSVAISAVKSVVLRKDGDNVTAVPHIYNGKMATIKTTKTGQFTLKQQLITFDDTADIYSKDDIEELAARHILFGTTETKYSPNAKISRAQLAVMIARAMDLQTATESHFKDIKGKWYASDVQALYEAGIAVGKTSSVFDPNTYVTREKAASMMSRVLTYAGMNIDASNLVMDYVDSDEISDDARADVAILKSLGIMTGKEDNQFDPQAALTRAQVAKVLSATLKRAKLI